jgi:hypothetical protein
MLSIPALEPLTRFKFDGDSKSANAVNAQARELKVNK